MRPKKFGLKPANTSVERFKRTCRITPVISTAASSFTGSPSTKAQKIAFTVLQKLPVSELIKGVEKKRLFRRTAENAFVNKKVIGPMHCAERCNLAISLLNASGVKAWLARVLVPSKGLGETKWMFHDVVEFAEDGVVKTLVFDNLRLPQGVSEKYNFNILQGPIEDLFKFKSPLVFRAIDSKQIGGVGDWNEYKKYSAKLSSFSGLIKENEKNRRRINLLIKEGLIPKEIEGQI